MTFGPVLSYISFKIVQVFEQKHAPVASVGQKIAFSITLGQNQQEFSLPCISLQWHEPGKKIFGSVENEIMDSRFGKV